MPRRKLPWLQDSSGTADTAATHANCQRARTPDLRTPNSTGISPRRRRRRTNIDRTPSTSPPPAPPAQEFMEDGLDADDIWIMVEDEFLETAKLFTRHLHHAEYQRLKRQVISRNAAMISQLSAMKTTDDATRQPDLENTPSIPSEGSKRSKEHQAPGDAEEIPWMRDIHLARLMRQPRELSAPLTRVAGPKPRTRASAGFSRAALSLPERSTGRALTRSAGTRQGRLVEVGEGSKHGSETEGENDLDSVAPLSKPLRIDANKRPSSLTTGESAGRDTSTLSRLKKRPPDMSLNFTRSSSSKILDTPATRKSLFTSGGPSESSESSFLVSKGTRSSAEELRDDIPNRQLSTTVADRIAKLKADKAKKDRESRKSVLLEEIPTFLV